MVAGEQERGVSSRFSYSHKLYTKQFHLMCRSADTTEFDFTGMKSLFHTPKSKNSADPSEMFEMKLFRSGGSEVSFASPIACTAKKPIGPLRREPMSSRLKNSTVPAPPVFDAEPAEKITTRRSTRKGNGKTKAGTRKTTRATRCSTRAKSNATPAVEEKPQPTYSTRSRRKKMETEVTEPQLVATPVLKSELEVTQTHNLRSATKNKVTTETEVEPVVPTMPASIRTTRRSRAKASQGETSKPPEPVTKEESIPTRTTRSRSAKSKTSDPQPDTAKPLDRITPRTTRSQAKQVKTPVEKPASPVQDVPAGKRMLRSGRTAAAADSSKPLRRSARLKK